MCLVCPTIDINMRIGQPQNVCHFFFFFVNGVRSRTLPILCMGSVENYHEIFKEKLGPENRVNCPPVKLEIDHSRGIKPVKNTKAFDIPIHLRKAATAEFSEMKKAGLIVETKNEASEWCSQAFPRRKPNSWPIKCRWVTDFRDLNKALKRPVWERESSVQLLRHVEPTA